MGQFSRPSAQSATGPSSLIRDHWSSSPRVLVSLHTPDNPRSEECQTSTVAFLGDGATAVAGVSGKGGPMTVAGPVVEKGTFRRPHAVAPGRRPPITLSPLAAPLRRPSSLACRHLNRTTAAGRWWWRLQGRLWRVRQLPPFGLCRWMSSSSVAGGARGRPARRRFPGRETASTATRRCATGPQGA